MYEYHSPVTYRCAADRDAMSAEAYASLLAESMLCHCQECDNARLSESARQLTWA